MLRYTREQELKRTAEMLEEIKSKYSNSCNTYFMIRFLLDSSYSIEDLKEICEQYLRPEKVELRGQPTKL